LKTGSERILVVEDNDRMRRIAARQLSELGYDVIEAGTAAAALDTLASGKSIRLLFTDVVMPGAMDGIALAREAHARQPDLKVLLTSGFPEGRFDEVGALPPGVRLLSKPYRNSDLARIVREVLDSESRPGDGTAMFRG
jgi:CheY-like chemotaxis protein